MWPTPRATERMGYYEQPSPSMIKGTHGWSLPAAVTDEASEKSHRKWPTPQASDHLANQSETLEAWEKRAAKKKEQGINLQFALRHAVQKDPGKMWPTPRSSKIMNMTMESALNRIENTGYHSNLEEKVALEEQKMLPTPSSRDYKGGSGTIKEKDGKYYRQSNTTGTKYGVRLDALVEYQNKAQDKTSKASLNPDWVEWLMGYPPGWTDISDSSKNPASQE